ncbi:glycosyltransferase family 2 protein [Fictibacillus iocasae]|uniref:Glycosyltransferase family 2 protein n=1 Tax=Fictibacillus iocasae TaxID=2715437 RepID=A0ABW2NUT9_9BACL
MDNQTAKKILTVLQAGQEGINYLENCIKHGEISLSDISILDVLVEMLESVGNSILQVSVPNRVNNIINNIQFYIDRLKQNAYNDYVEVFVYDFRFHLCSLFKILEYEIAYIVEGIVNKEEYPQLYPKVEVVDHNDILLKGSKARFKVSIVLLAYNNLSYTRNCVESILKNTNDIDYELILVDNGSTDGTKEYFDSVSGAKVIHLKYNLHIVKGFNIGLMAAEGKYCAAVCNDFIFTPNWLKNLIICIESDSNIGFVSPGATSISNMQQISIPHNSIEDFLEKARDYNNSDSTKWEERVVLLPNVLCCPTALLERIGYYDTRFYRGEFLDDDISFKIRRAGYKLIYCADTVTYHYGSLTTASDHQTNSLEEGRKTFLNKYGLDAWLDARMTASYLNLNYNQLSNVKSIMGIDVKCGATLLQIKNQIWAKFKMKPHLSVFTTEQKYEIDLNTISEDVFMFNTFDQLSCGFNSSTDLIYIEKPLDCYSDNLDIIFGNLAKLMNTKGKIIFMVNNNLSIASLYEQINSLHSIHSRKIYIRDMVCLKAKEYGFDHLSIINFKEEFNPESNQVVGELARLLSNGEELQIKYLESLFHTNFTMYQMNYIN